MPFDASRQQGCTKTPFVNNNSERKILMKKRVISLFLVLVMVLGILPVSIFASGETNYELRVLDFEGDYWNGLIDDPQYGGVQLYGESGMGMESPYAWYDENTNLMHEFLPSNGGYGYDLSYCYWSGGEAISDYTSGDFTTYGDFNSQLTVYQAGVSGLERTGGGHNGSDNFAVHYGYADNSDYGLGEEALPFIAFADGAHVIDSMWVTNTCYAVNCYIDGNNLTACIGEDDWVKIVATGYVDDMPGETSEFYLCNGPQHIVTDWTKWDLSGLGAVTKVTFNILGSSDNGYGFSQPAYFAFDDVAVRYETAPAHVHDLTLHEQVLPTALTDGNTEYYSCTCGMFFSDAGATAEIAANSWIIPAGSIEQNMVETQIKFSQGTGKLYAKADTQRTRDFLSGAAKTDNVYTAEIPEGDYVFDGYSDELYLGSIELNVTEGHSDFSGAYGDHGEIIAVTLANSQTDWVYGTDFTFENLSVMSGGQFLPVQRSVVMGENKTANCKTVLIHEGDTVTVDLVPQGDKAASYATVNGYKTCNAGYTFLSVTPVTKCTAAVTYPYADTDSDGENDYILEFGILKAGSNFVYDYYTPAIVSEPNLSDNTVTATFNAAKSTTYFYKVTNPLNENAVSYGNYVKTAGTDGTTAITVTTAQMYVNDSAKNKHTVIRDYSVNQYDSGDLYLASNAEGFQSRPGTGNQGVIRMDTSANSTCTLYPYRNWLIIEGINNAQVIEPDFHVEVINVEGSPITVTENTANNAKKHSFEIQANSTGTAILLVTYDALTADYAMGNGKFFSAIRPENTGVVVVTVNGTDDVVSNMYNPADAANVEMDEPGTAATGNSARTGGRYMDAELDVLYFCTDEGAQYSFTPEAGTVVTMAKAVQNGSVSFSSDGVSVQDGVVTLSGIPEGKTIVKLTNGGKVSYQVIRATRTNVVVKNSAGAVYYDSAAGILDESVKFAAGDKVTMTYSKLEHPAQKLSGIYNMNCNVVPYGEGISLEKGSGYGVYTFNSTPSSWTVTATIPGTFTGESYTLSALIRSTGFGSYYGQHRELAYEIGKSPNFTAVQQNTWFAITSVELPMATAIPMTVNTVDAQSAPVAGAAVTVLDSDGNVIEPAAGIYAVFPGKVYTYQADKAGMKRSLASVTVPSDAESYTLNVVMTALADGDYGTEPSAAPLAADGYYEISNGAQLAWFVQQVNSGSGASYKVRLMADIDLGNLDWTPIGTSTKNYTGTFDGNGHVIRGLYINAAASYQALFGYLNAAAVKNLGVYGNVKTTNNYAAGIVAYAKGAYNIDNCFSAVNVTGKNNVGGIVGCPVSGTITNCYNVGNITAAKYGGGISGCATPANVGIATNCYNIGKVNCASAGGGINPGAAAKAVNSYYLNGCYVTGTSAKAGTAKTAEELKAMASTLGAAFVPDTHNVNNGYPILAWFAAKEPLVIHKNEKVDLADNMEIELGDIAEGATVTVGENSTVTIHGDIDEGAAVILNSTSKLVLENSFFFGTVDLNGGELTIGTDVVVAGGQIESTVDCSQLKFKDVTETEEKSIITAVAENNMDLENGKKALPLKSDDHTYTVCKLNTKGGIWCPTNIPEADAHYKFRMMPRFASQQAYDILANAENADTFMMGFTISAVHNGEDVTIANNKTGEKSKKLDCDYTLENIRNFFTAEKDKAVLYVNIGGIGEDYEVKIVPYFKINGLVVYTASTEPGSTEYAQLVK